MLRFFSKIRYRLAAQNRAAKYIRYAVGEILLVVIGILIALQVNNWNEHRKNHQDEIKYLEDFRHDLKNDIIQLEQLAKITTIKSDKCIKLLYIIKNNSEINLFEFSTDILNLLFGADFVPNDNTYTAFINSGSLNLIENDSIKTQLIQIYSNYEDINQAENFMKREYEQFIFNRAFEKIKNIEFFNLDTFAIEQKHIPDSVLIEQNAPMLRAKVKALLDDERFSNGLFSFSVNNRNISELYTETSDKIKVLLALINNELKE